MIHTCPYVSLQMASVTLKFLRAAAMSGAVMKMRDNNIFPCRIRATEDNPLGSDWDNTADVLWRFFTHYLVMEGIPDEGSPIAQSIRNYIFHGVYNFVRTVRKQVIVSQKPIIHALHFQLTNHRSRYVSGVEKHFVNFFQLLDKNPKWVQFLDDKGEGTPPRRYLIAVEQGIREYAFAPNAKQTMGVPPQKATKKTYSRTPAYRKMECYITGVRYKRGKTSYRKWEDFSWVDFTERNLLASTFMARHMPLSDGNDHFGGELQDPPQWSSNAGSVHRKNSSSKKQEQVKPEPAQPAHMAHADPVPMRFDPQTQCLVPYIDLS